MPGLETSMPTEPITSERGQNGLLRKAGGVAGALALTVLAACSGGDSAEGGFGAAANTEPVTIGGAEYTSCAQLAIAATEGELTECSDAANEAFNETASRDPNLLGSLPGEISTGSMGTKSDEAQVLALVEACDHTDGAGDFDTYREYMDFLDNNFSIGRDDINTARPLVMAAESLLRC